MAERGEVTVVTVGGKGWSLSPSIVYTIATGHTRVRIDSSALDRLSNNILPSVQSQFPIPIPIPNNLTVEETRASLTVLLNKFLIASASSSKNIRTLVPVLISETLNSTKTTIDSFQSLDFTEEEGVVVEKSSAVLQGICAILDHQSTALTTIVDAVAALSCEALKANVAAFNSLDSGDGFVDKEANGVASDIKVLLTGSNLVGTDGTKPPVPEISEIPKINGKLREVVKSLHLSTRVDLNSNSAVKSGTRGAGRAVGTTVSSLGVALRNLGESSLCRVKMNLEAIGIEGLRNSLEGVFERGCPNGESVTNGFKLVTLALVDEDYVKFVQQVNVLLGIVWKIVAWEAVTAFVALEGGDLSEKGKEVVEVNGSNVKEDKNKIKKKKKKKKVATGKGTSVMVQLIKERLQSKGADCLEKWTEDLLLFLDPKDSEFDSLLKKVKEIVESNESRRLPKIPKVITSLNFIT